MQHGRISVRRRLLATLLALFAAALAALYLLVRGYAHQTADTTYDQLLRASVLSIADSLQLVQGEWRMDMPYASLALLEQAPRDRVFYRVVATGGELVSGYADLPSPPARADAGPADTPRLYDARYQDEPVRVAWMERKIAGPRDAETAVIQVAQTREARNALAAGILWQGTLALIGFAAAALALAYWGLQRSLSPIQRIERELAARNASDLHPIAAPVPEELDTLVHALDGFMARLSENLDTLRLFIAEAAHQLRTPLAALHAQMEVALDEEDPAEERRSLLAVLRNAEKLSRLVNQLLSDASVIHRSNVRQFQPVDLAELLSQALYDTVPQADPQPDVRLSLPAAANPPRVMGDSLMLREAFKNLIDNALRHGATEDGHIDVRLEADGADWRVIVSDQGPGIAPALANTAFERFARGPNPRSPGAGLGLSIIKRVVDIHQGRLVLSNRVGGGLEAAITLPGMPQDA
ncbi:sensor histidine kinase [Achromobacter denitrificans]|uniref:histidine kinase n=1 Tax=Achromobacter denitrificans TaxID=32002 RepID=A0ABZ3G5A7_ACHDE|nr:sensor histidine kinase [Achromobacter denitrificans]MDX3877903.1 sensor histidine kinase N-terminal domain-containing protein [Achromobacter sp.]MBV2160892.1 sensor histidine kinase N-terminal domain-containing protein [Achromobacter denitrificans]MDF3851216.1 sensor histidine kinase N-terminal domain-containing protein [Achromobacter denitrificans]WFC67103.1 sensor histidine kinase [Achromobacter denitrificans]CAB3812801.1 Adaptive-response sensory-kinase SasA [Achromobacter denitrificans